MNMMQILNNPMVKQILNSKNPQQMLLNMINQNPQIKNNPMVQNAFNMMSNGDIKGLENLGRNLSKNAGFDPDQKVNELKNMFGIR